jgi:hypothetical protein
MLTFSGQQQKMVTKNIYLILHLEVNMNVPQQCCTKCQYKSKILNLVCSTFTRHKKHQPFFCPYYIYKISHAGSLSDNNVRGKKVTIFQLHLIFTFLKCYSKSLGIKNKIIRILLLMETSYVLLISVFYLISSNNCKTVSMIGETY